METVYFKKAFRIKLLTALIFTLTACSKNEREYSLQSNAFNGSRQSMQHFVTPQLFETMQQLGLTTYYGNLPPFVDGQYLASELLLQASNIPTDILNLEYADTYFTFKNQNSRNLTIDMTYVTDNGTESAHGDQTVIAGNGSRFTIFGKQTVTEDEGSADTIIIVSGKLTPEGISDFQFGVFMLDNHGISGFIENRQGRLFYDSDNLAQKQ